MSLPPWIATTKVFTSTINGDEIQNIMHVHVPGTRSQVSRK